MTCGYPPPSAADGLLWLITAEPTLAPPATHRDYARRVRAEFPCIRCPRTAEVALIVHTDAGPRWIDLCRWCAGWLRANLSQPRFAPPA